MFGNLVKLNLIRLFKSRATLISTVTVIMVTVFNFFLYYYLKDLILDGTTKQPVYFWGTYHFIMAAGTIFPAICIIVTFMVCDYYKFRQMINIEGICRNKAKLVFSEVAAIFVFSFASSLYPMLCATIGSLLDEVKFGLLIHAPLTTLSIYLALSLAYFSLLVPVYTFAKIYRKKFPVFITAILALPVIVFFAGFLDGVNNLDGANVFPALTLLDFALGDIDHINFPVVFLLLIAQNLGWILISIAASNRKSDL